MDCTIEKKPMFWKAIIVSILGIALIGCGATIPEQPQDGRHIEASADEASSDIPEIIDADPTSISPEDNAYQEAPALYSVVAQDLPIRELLFTIARDANINIDIHPEISGRVSLNAVDQTLPQILDRISRQASIRWSVDFNGNLLIEADRPYWDTYRVDYVNVTRNADTSAAISNTIGGSTAGGSSSANISQNSSNNFWTSLTENLEAMLKEETVISSDEEGEQQTSETLDNVIVNAESGVIAIRGTSAQHNEVRSFINFVETRSLQQVLIEATVVEVALSDQYQAGVDWTAIDNNGRINLGQSLLAGNLGSAPRGTATYNGSDIDFMVSALSQFGNSQVLSSPKIMALNNQPAMLRVVDNRVYFTIEVEPAVATEGVVINSTIETEVNTVPIGFSMSVTPQVGDNEQVTLNVRPTISRIAGFVNDPNPVLAEQDIVNPIPEIQIREMESVLKVFSGQTAILGGLMQDSLETSTDGIPVASRVPLVGNLFSYRDDTASKTELIIFIRPVIIDQPSLDADLSGFKQFLPIEGGRGLNTSNNINSDFWRQ